MSRVRSVKRLVRNILKRQKRLRFSSKKSKKMKKWQNEIMINYFWFCKDFWVIRIMNRWLLKLCILCRWVCRHARLSHCCRFFIQMLLFMWRILSGKKTNSISCFHFPAPRRFSFLMKKISIPRFRDGCANG